MRRDALLGLDVDDNGPKLGAWAELRVRGWPQL